MKSGPRSGPCNGDKPSLYKFFGIAHIILGFLSVALQSGALIISEDHYMYNTVLRLHHVFRASPGIWAGAASFVCGVLSIIAAKRLRETFHDLDSERLHERFLCVTEALGALNIVAAIFNIAMTIIHTYIMIVLARVLRGLYGKYEHTSKIHVIILFILSGLLVVLGLLEIATHIAGAVSACRGNKNARQEMQYDEVPLRK